MAEDTRDDIEVTEPAAGNKNKLLIIIIAVLVLAMAGLAAFMLMSGEKSAESEPSEEVFVKQAPIYYTVEAPFVVNFADQSKGAVRYLQVKMKVMARDKAVIDAFQLHEPAIQHELLMLFYSQSYDDLITSEGTAALQQASLEKINEVLLAEEATMQNQLEAVYFTSFVMQ